jgi:hypothetical protein
MILPSKCDGRRGNVHNIPSPPSIVIDLKIEDDRLTENQHYQYSFWLQALALAISMQDEDVEDQLSSDHSSSEIDATEEADIKKSVKIGQCIYIYIYILSYVLFPGTSMQMHDFTCLSLLIATISVPIHSHDAVHLSNTTFIAMTKYISYYRKVIFVSSI